MSLDEIAALEALKGAEVRQAKAVLAFEATKLAHGEEAAERARDAAAAAFSGGVSADMPTVSVSLPAGILDLLVEAGLCKSKGDARRQVQQGAVKVGADRETRVDDVGHMVTDETVLWRGKKNCARVVSA